MKFCWLTAFPSVEMVLKTFENDENMCSGGGGYTYGGRDTRQVNTLRCSTAEATISVDGGKESIHGLLTAKARSTEEACLVIPGIAEIRFDRCRAGSLQSAARAIIRRLTLRRRGVGGESAEGENEERSRHHGRS